jgi:chorismate dehydratase
MGVVEFLNTQPIIAGLDRCTSVSLTHAVPSQLVGLLERDEVDVALCSSIDYLRSDSPMVVLSAPSLGCCGPTRTVRLYSTCAFDSIETVHCDTDSHTSVVLLQVLWRELYGRVIDVQPFHAASASGDWPESVLLIGDKVVSGAPPASQYTNQIDLGEAWHSLTGLPFMFGLWLARADGDPALHRSAMSLLDRQYRYNQLHIETIVARESKARNWPPELVHEYFESGMHYAFGAEQQAGLRRFFDLAESHELVPSPRSLEIVEPLVVN